jgi:hypothetical protein
MFDCGDSMAFIIISLGGEIFGGSKAGNLLGVF